MAQLLIREVSEVLVLAFKERAAANGRSAEAEHRVILEEAFRKLRRVPQVGRQLRAATARRYGRCPSWEGGQPERA